MNRRIGVAVMVIALFGGAVVAAPSIAINEVAWGGSPSDHTEEWIELISVADREIDLEGWRLSSSDGAPDIVLAGVLAPRSGSNPSAGFFLLVRETDGSTPGITADLLYSGALNDAGETLYLYDAQGELVDSANAPLAEEADPGPWPAGAPARGDTPPRTMERVDPLHPDEPVNWRTSPCPTDPADTIGPCGTPKAENDAFNRPPTVAIAIDPWIPEPNERVLFDAADSSDENDQIVSFTWDFGDGTEGRGQTASHTYAVEGEYTVRLTAEDGKGARASASELVSVRPPIPPVADFSLLPPDAIYRAGEPMVFRSESSAGSIDLIEWTWDFGDGRIATGAETTHIFESSGDYVVRLRVVDARGNAAEREEVIGVASRVPTACFTIVQEVLHDGEPILFDATSSIDPDGEIASYRWDFDGDDIVDLVGGDALAEHEYTAGGIYSPSLVVEDADGDRSIPFVETIHVNAGPIAQFSISTFEAEELEDVRFTDCSTDTDGTIVSWLWDFGDGETSIQTSPTHAFGASGDATVTLTVVDDRGASRTGTVTLEITNLPPIAALEASPAETAETGTPIRFDACASADPSPEGSIVRYEWDIDGDGAFDRETSTASLTHRYGDDGSFTVSVRVTDDRGASATSEPITITVLNRPPTISRVVWVPTDPTDGAVVSFSADVADPDGDVIAWRWTFGGEGSETSESPTHTFQTDSIYTVTLIARDDDGANSEPLTVDVPIANALPVASFSFLPTDPETVSFDGRGSSDPSPNGRIVHIAWDFGDGQTCPGREGSCGGTDRAAPTHRFPGPGTYYVTLVVIDDDGGIGRMTHAVTIR